MDRTRNSRRLNADYPITNNESRRRRDKNVPFRYACQICTAHRCPKIMRIWLAAVALDLPFDTA